MRLFNLGVFCSCWWDKHYSNTQTHNGSQKERSKQEKRVSWVKLTQPRNLPTVTDKWGGFLAVPTSVITANAHCILIHINITATD
jgi:hypothetical protein